MTKIDIYYKINKSEENGSFSPYIAKIERKLVPIVEKMENIGIKIDIDRFDELEEYTSNELEELRIKIFGQVGREFIINSPSVVSDILFNELKLPNSKLGNTKKGKISISSKELYKIRNVHPIIEDIIKYRELNKLHSTYIKVLPNVADKNYRIKSVYDQLGTTTGRMSSSGPNLQNITSHSKIGKKIRHGFVSKKGYSFLSCDYSQIELRLIAHIAKEEKLLKAFRNKEDIHTKTASEVFNIPFGKVTEDQRFKAKGLNFGVLYGISPKGFSDIAKCTYDEAEKYISDYYITFINIMKYISDTKDFARKKGYVETIWKRRKYVPNINSTYLKERYSAERMAINHPVQGTAADIIKKAMILVNNKILSKNNDIDMLIQVHDELLFEVRDDKILFYAEKIKNIMSESIILKDVEITVDAKVGKNLRDLDRVNI